MSDVYYQFPTGMTLTISVIDDVNDTPETATGTEVADGLYVFDVETKRAIATVLLDDTAVDAGTIKEVDGKLWIVARQAASEAVISEEQITQILDAINSMPPSTVISQSEAEQDPTSITCKVGETIAKSVTCLSADGTPVDLSDLGTLIWIVEQATPPRTDMQVIEHDDITIAGDDNNRASFVPSSQLVAKPGVYSHALRIASSGKVLSEGVLTVKYAAIQDSP